ncbi:B-cell lymphoma/leukemia 11A-like [Limulus polyphemus]|uniref:B-cell lymphoma/leukemia 11A-like n=1 Tax=Limulus polyphemus TaxID=6850 RepID=A0ABM1SFJ9_LIMPO|nr:B-cell lymphoma/leukemia 11A-like [Limulus polyphemus]
MTVSHRPLQRYDPHKSIDAASRDFTADPVILQDVLTCGVCQEDFALSDIVKFIQHKVHNCNKENCAYYNGGDIDGLRKNDDSSNAFQLRQPTISATICKMDLALSSFPNKLEETCRNPVLALEPFKDSRARTSPDSVQLKNTLSTDPEGTLKENRSNSEEPSSPVEGAHQQGRVVDADTNTTSTEPTSHICSTCKQNFSSAWLLVQHVQRIHGLVIYEETNNKDKNVPEVPKSAPVSVFPSNTLSSPITTVSQEQSVSHSNDLNIVPYLNLQLPRIPLGERQFGPALNSPKYFPHSSSHGFQMDLFSDQYYKLNHLAGLSLNHFDSFSSCTRTRFDSPRESHIGLGFESHMDFYSQRLRQLAGATSSSPATSLKFNSSFSNSVICNQPSSHQSTPSSPHPVFNPFLSQVLSPNTSQKALDNSESPICKSRDICGKSLQFQSNPIVNRRSHTGEKPFNCHICNHSCTQASKLKRHMKTHQKPFPDSSKDTGVCLKRSIPNSAAKNIKPNNGEEDEDGSENQDENENEELENEEVLKKDDSEEITAEDLTTKRTTKFASYLAVGDENGKNNSNNKRSTPPQEGKSLLGEVMEKIGLNNIQQYNEAYKQALEENKFRRLSVKKERPSSAPVEKYPLRKSFVPPENWLNQPPWEEGNNKFNQTPIHLGQDILPVFDSHFDDNKRLRLDLRDHQRENLYAGLWLPSVTPSRREILLRGITSSESDHRSSSALIAAMPILPGTSTPTTTLFSKLKEKSRNDTCEYCGKVFKNCSNLTVHKRSHTGEKPYKCTMCDYACAQSSKLTRHMKTHGRMGKDVFRCRFCGMPFSVSSTLEKHMRKCVVNQSAFLIDKDTGSRDDNYSDILVERDHARRQMNGRDLDSRETP